MTPSAIRTSSIQRSDVEYVSLPIGVLARGARRFEGETYLTGGYAIRLQIGRGGAPFSPLETLGRVWQPGRLKGIRVTSQHGTPFLTATQMFDIRPAPRKWLAPTKTSDLARRYVEREWILVTCSGNVGTSILGYTPHLGIIISHDLLRIVIEEESQLGYLYGFLRSRFGRAMLRSSQYGSIIKHLEPEHVQDIPVVLAPKALREEMNDRIRRVFRLRDEAFELTRDAEARFGAAVGVTLGAEADEAAYSVSSREMFGRRRRLDGYHFNPTAERALDAIRRSGKPIDHLETLVERIFGVPRFKHVYTNTGIPYLDSEDIFKVNPEIEKFIPGVAKRDAQAYFVERGWLLMACSGQLYGTNGSVVLANRWHEGKIISNHVVRLVPRAAGKGARLGYLQMVLGHPGYGRPLVLRLAFGTEVPEIAPGDLADFPVVRLSSVAEDAIADAVERASELRLKANEAEDQAVRLVEQHVEAALGPGAARLNLFVSPQPYAEEGNSVD